MTGKITTWPVRGLAIAASTSGVRSISSKRSERVWPSATARARALPPASGTSQPCVVAASDSPSG